MQGGITIRIETTRTNDSGEPVEQVEETIYASPAALPEGPERERVLRAANYIIVEVLNELN